MIPVAAASVYPRMSPYEQKAWESLQQEFAKRQSRRAKVPGRMQARGKKITTGMINKWDSVPGNERIETMFAQALSGLQQATLDPAMRSVRTDRVLKAYNKRDHGTFNRLEDVRALDLRYCDEAIPHLRLIYSLGAGVEGAATSLAITGAEVASSVSNGASLGVVAGAMAADAATLIATMARVTAHTGAYYGYDVRQPEEELFALGVIAFTTSANPASQVAALAELSRLTQQMMRHATWEVLGKDPLVKVIQRVFVMLGIRLTKAKLAQVVPIAGVILSSGLNIRSTQHVANDARFAYRMRFLMDKYGLDPTTIYGTSRTSPGDDSDTINLS